MLIVSMDKKKKTGWVDDENHKKRTIYISEQLDKKMRLISAERGTSYSEIAIEAFEDFVSKTGGKRKTQ